MFDGWILGDVIFIVVALPPRFWEIADDQQFTNGWIESAQLIVVEPECCDCLLARLYRHPHDPGSCENDLRFRNKPLHLYRSYRSNQCEKKFSGAYMLRSLYLVSWCLEPHLVGDNSCCQNNCMP